MEFIVKDITKFDIENGIIGGKVEFNLPDEAGDVAVLQGVSIDLRIQSHDDLTLSQIEELLLKKQWINYAPLCPITQTRQHMIFVCSQSSFH